MVVGDHTAEDASTGGCRLEGILVFSFRLIAVGDFSPHLPYRVNKNDWNATKVTISYGDCVTKESTHQQDALKFV